MKFFAAISLTFLVLAPLLPASYKTDGLKVAHATNWAPAEEEGGQTQDPTQDECSFCGPGCTREVACKDGGTVGCSGSFGQCSYRVGACRVVSGEHVPGYVICNGNKEECNYCMTCCKK